MQFDLIQADNKEDLLEASSRADADGWVVVNFAVGDNHFYVFLQKDTASKKDRSVSITSAENA